MYLSVGEPVEAIADGVDSVSLGQSDSHGRAHRRIHAGGRSADIQDRHGVLTLSAWRQDEEQLLQFSLNQYYLNSHIYRVVTLLARGEDDEQLLL